MPNTQRLAGIFIRWAVLAVAVLALAAWVVGASKTFRNCVYEAKKHAGEQQLKEGVSQFSTASVYRDCTGEFLHKNGEAVVAFFTIILAFSTIGLWISTYLLYRAGERQIKTSRQVASIQARQTQASIREARRSADATNVAANAAELSARAAFSAERAYIAAGVNFRHMFEGDNVMLVTMSNYGKTPAFIGTVAVGSRPEERLNEKPRWSNIRFAGYVLPYNPDVKNPFVSDVIFEPPIIGDVVFGRIWYRDVFGGYWSSGFALRAQSGLPAVSGHDEYWEERSEPDLGPTVHPPFVDPTISVQ